MDRNKTIERFQQLIAELEAMPANDDDALTPWLERAELAVRKAFGAECDYLNKVLFARRLYNTRILNGVASDLAGRKRTVELLAVLKACILELEEYPHAEPAAESCASATRPAVRVFVSHASTDKQLADRLVALIRVALRLRASEIRCTSVDGHRLRAGDDVDDQLRREVLEAEAVLAIVSLDSLESHYVGFELGARWGTRKYLVPLLAPGISPSMLPGPISRLNAIKLEERDQLYQLVTNVAAELGEQPELPESLGSLVSAIVDSSPASDEVTRMADGPRNFTREALSTELLVALRYIGMTGTQVDLEMIARGLGVSPQRARYYMDELEARDLVDPNRSYAGSDHWSVSASGRRLLVEGGLHRTRTEVNMRWPASIRLRYPVSQ